MSGAPQPASRAVLVTGAARGLARGIVADLAGAGYRVAFTFRPGGTPPDETLAAVNRRGAEAFAFACDHALEGATADAVRAVEKAFGGLDVLVHAVGPMLIRRFEGASLADYHAMFDANVRSAVEAALTALPPMRERGFGRVVFFGMNGSHVTLPARGLSFYAAAKAAVASLARTLALEEAKYGITVNLIEPGDIRDKEIDRAAARAVSAKNPTGHAGSWEDVAYAVRFLVSDEASFINGATIPVAGGLREPHE